MSEATYQAKRIKQLEKEGWYVIKLIKTNKNGIPDVLAFKPSPDIEFFEMKAKKGKPSKLQEYRIKELTAFGVKAVLDYEN